MIRTNWIAGLLALALFTTAQYQGWSLFASEPEAQTARSSGSGGRPWHK
ncbi:hypothetical protein [Accumulibacter sp.]|nr:hypothetical protein [Accumulibacter sp.]MCM8596121.1 hypothetical protein [Accumulibacter sp.]MCM8626680.1 hypothetical protein [Accumulibacter sp.]MDS4050270.1 hypothetical protein [Accumulibacter sp.]